MGGKSSRRRDAKVTDTPTSISTRVAALTASQKAFFSDRLLAAKGKTPGMIKRLPLRYFRSWEGLLVALFLIAILIWTFQKIDQPAYTQPDGGSVQSFTPFNDYLILMGGKNFQEEGFVANYFLADMTVGYPEFARGWYAYQTPLPDVQNARIYYIHYGSIDAMVVGLLRHIGVTELPDLYKIAAVFSIIALGIWYGIARLLFGRIVALVSLIFIGTSLVFLNFIDNIAAYTYDILFSFGAILLFLLAERNRDVWKSRRKMAYGGAWLLTSLAAYNSPEFIPFLMLFFVGYLWAARGMKRTLKRWKTAALMISAPIVAQLLHLFQVAWALGGLDRAATDFWAAIERRTMGFALAEETGHRHFTLTEAIPKINDDLWAALRLEFIGLVALLVLAWWLTHRLSKHFPDETRDQLWFHWKLLLVFFVAGISFWVLMIQSTVTNAGSVYRTILPFAGLALGYCLANIVLYLRFRQEPLILRAIVLVALVVIAAPTLLDRLSGRPFHFELHQQRMDMYYGVYTTEIKMLGSFLQEKTAYGDIVITDFRVAETGHPRYPFPGYEYESDRRIEVARNVDQATTALRDFEQVRASLPSDNPASGVRFYLLTDEGGIEDDFGEFAQQVGDLQDTLYETDYWTELHGTVPFPTGSCVTFPPRIFYLFKVDAVKFDDHQLAAENTYGQDPQL